ncbi:MAG TPA: Xaa-Pro peptidase family protein [Nitrolancea sp.]|nr:Xaa-Pro peptidase family protein [Nitrolancea sp.]
MRFQQRLNEFRQRMTEADVDLVYLPRGANLFYLAGIRRQYDHGTDHNAYGDWACGGYIGREGGIVLVAPRMGGSFFVNEAMDKEWIDHVRLIQESETPLDVMSEVVNGFGTLKHVALDERTWARTSDALHALLPDARFTLASDLVNPMRMIKDDDEILEMRYASTLADKVFGLVVPKLKTGVSELEITQEVDYQFLKLGAESTSFQTSVYIIGPEEQGAWPGESHGGTRTLRPGDSLMFDFGCVSGGYCSDFGRSVFVGEPTIEYLRVHETVLEAQRVAIQAMKSAVITTSEVNALARQVIADAGYDAGFTHRLGHAIGCTVHEPPFLDVMDHTVLRTRMMFTVEPSVLFRGRFGNRVEDVVMVTALGGEVLNQASHELTVVE